VIKAFTIDQLNDPKGAFIRSQAGQRLLAGLRSTCFG
jgi:hypothetical protein